MDGTTLIGIIGAGLILLGFVLNELHKLDRDSLAYDVINFIGGSLLVVYAWQLESMPFLVLNVIWTVVSLRDIVIDLQQK